MPWTPVNHYSILVEQSVLKTNSDWLSISDSSLSSTFTSLSPVLKIIVNLSSYRYIRLMNVFIRALQYIISFALPFFIWVRKNLISFSDKIDDIRKEMQLSKDKFAALCGVSSATICAVCKPDGHISINSAEKIAKGLNAPVQKLFELHLDTGGLSDKTILHYHKLNTGTGDPWQAYPLQHRRQEPYEGSKAGA